MSSFNRVILLGNLTRDPEMRVTPKGTAITQFGLAVNRSWKNDSGQTQEETTFVDIESFGKQAETIAKYCTKGRPLFVEGRLKLDQWDDKASGQKRSKLKVILESFQFIGGQRDGVNGSGAGSRGDSASERAPVGAGRGAPADEPDDDVPFAGLGAASL